MKKISILLVFVMLFTFPLSAFAESGNLSIDISKLTEKYSGYDLSNINEVAKIYSDDAEFQKLVKEFTQDKINEATAKAVKISQDKKIKTAQKLINI